ncbi:RagB/SusD family nutrient uptake outer membrane protein, partial [Algoriphagus sp. PAP.12]|uniref:RagB/SusD family nutrient uptake outer membrane protein n=1 Tax=Algoriphagus sp. PAP.12 TaxID=2996678 RepID=UPI00227ABD82
DTLLTQTFETGDLRVRSYYSLSTDSLYNMTGHHTGNTVLFGGLSVGEIQLIAAEGYSRSGNLEMGNLYLNELLRNRYDKESWEDLMIEEQEELLKRILLERRKELIGRGIRWSDLRRLNQETGSEITLERVIDGETYSL